PHFSISVIANPHKIARNQKNDTFTLNEELSLAISLLLTKKEKGSKEYSLMLRNKARRKIPQRCLIR
ncbi:hypothetical protein, partial [Heliomicrobium gestii]|uniref:hypothetical protein n=1 Tax=Heliomicrobium gestii TaxID=2699 RepID=UPI001A9AE64E